MKILYANKDLYPEFSIMSTHTYKWKYIWPLTLKHFDQLTINFNIIVENNSLYLSGIDFFEYVEEYLWKINHKKFKIYIKWGDLYIIRDEFKLENTITIKKEYGITIKKNSYISDIKLLSKNLKNISWILFPKYEKYILDRDFSSIPYKEYEFQQYEDWKSDNYIIQWSIEDDF